MEEKIALRDNDVLEVYRPQSFVVPMDKPETVNIGPTTVLQPVIHPIIQKVAPPQQNSLGPDGIRIICPHCLADQKTSTVKRASVKAYVAATFLWLIGCGICCCCLIPFCLDSCKNTEHRCANCNTFVGSHGNV